MAHFALDTPPKMIARSLLSLLVLSSTVSAQIFSLSALDWTLKNSNGSIVVPASVPSQVHLDLANVGIITEPLLGANDFTQRWIINDNWTYTADVTSFVSALSTNPTTTTLLVFYGLDTVANITLKGQPVAWVNNQFRQYIYDVSSILLQNTTGVDNNLTVSFESAAIYGHNVSTLPEMEFFPAGVSVFEYPDGHPYVRKGASDFGWDWGPAFVPSGIFKPAYFITLGTDASTDMTSTSSLSNIVASSSIFIEEKSIEIFREGQQPSIPPNQTADWIVNVTLAVRSLTAADEPNLMISFPELKVTSDPIPLPAIPGGAVPTFVSANFTVPNGVPDLWFPHNLGDPKRYNITITLVPSLTSSCENISFTTTTGFRTIVLVQSPVTDEDISQKGITPGNAWHFEINGETFYSKGTNIIPFDPFYARIPTSKVRWIIESAKMSGQNMLRIWGGGIYQPSDEETGVYDFYEICDELGILAWSELIFSDNIYPINDFLIESIIPEVQQNIRRINRHPSVAQWAGGNEIEGIVEQVNVSLSNGTHYLNEFVTLFQDVLHDVVLNETTSLAYTDCSTTSGYISLDPYVLRFNNETEGFIYGNSERYNYDASQAFNYSTYPVSRFVNEFGFHSMPSFFSWEEVLQSPDDFSFNSTIVASRDHHPPAGNLSWPNPNAPQGQSQMTEAVQAWLPTPSTSDTNQTFAQWCFSTQVFQSLNMVSEIAWYRRGAGLGENNLGSLVWQLNDIWQGVSWSSIEYSGRWKVLNYGMASIYSPVTIYPFWTPSNQSLEVLVTSDLLYEVNGTAQLTWFGWDGTAISTAVTNFTTPSLNNSVIWDPVGLDTILPVGFNATDVWMLLNLTAETKHGLVTNEQYFTPTSLAIANLVDPAINVTTGDNFTFTLSAESGVAPFTWIDHPAGTVGVFKDNSTGLPLNGFYLIPGLERTLRFELNEDLSLSLSPDPADFVVRSLWNNTHL